MCERIFGLQVRYREFGNFLRNCLKSFWIFLKKTLEFFSESFEKFFGNFSGGIVLAEYFWRNFLVHSNFLGGFFVGFFFGRNSLGGN